MIKIASPSDYSFAVWMKGHPFSSHPLDDKRFYQFVKTIIRYKNEKYRNYQYFCSQVSKFHENVDEEKRDSKYHLMLNLIEFHKQASISTITLGGKGKNFLVKIVGTDIIYEEIIQDNNI